MIVICVPCRRPSLFWDKYSVVMTRPSHVSGTCYRVVYRRYSHRAASAGSACSSLRGPVVLLVRALVGEGPGRMSHTCDTASWCITSLTALITSCGNVARFKEAMESIRSATFCVRVWKAAICLSWTVTSWLITSQFHLRHPILQRLHCCRSTTTFA